MEKSVNNNDFSAFVEARWSSLPQAEKTAGAFAQAFSVAGGAFRNAADMKARLKELCALIDDCDWADAERQSALQAVTRGAFGYKSDDDFEQAEKAFDEADLYRPANMPFIAFKKKTFNVIGARTSRGKTTFAVSLLCDALERTDRQCVFVTLEETWEEIYARIYNAFLFSRARKTGDYAAANARHPKAQLAAFFRHPDSCHHRATLQRVRERIRACEAAGRLQVYDLSGRDIGDVETVCGAYPGAIVIIDYVTKIRPSERYAQSSRLDGYNDIADRLEELAKQSDLTIIAAAQVRRPDGRVAADSDTPDTFNDTQLKECGKLEETANTIVFIGRNTAQKDNMGIPGHDKGEAVYFWKIIKNRGGRGVNQSYLFNTTAGAMGYSYMEGLKEPVCANGLTNKEGCRLKGDSDEDAQAEPVSRGGSPADDDSTNAEKKGAGQAAFLNSEQFSFWRKEECEGKEL